MWKNSYQRMDEHTLNIQFLTSLKQFFKSKNLDLPMKQIFQAVQSREKGLETSDEPFWQLIQIMFTGMYLESTQSGENVFLREFFEVEIKGDVILLRMVLDIIHQCLKWVELGQEAFENSAFLNSSARFDKEGILEDMELVEEETSGYMSNRNLLGMEGDEYKSGQGYTSTSAVLPKNTYGFKIDLEATKTPRKNSAELQDELDDELLAQNHTEWDVFKDAHLFE